MESSVNLTFGLKLGSVSFAHLMVPFVVQLMVKSSMPRRAKIVSGRDLIKFNFWAPISVQRHLLAARSAKYLDC